jgi:hypothetical protein
MAVVCHERAVMQAESHGWDRWIDRIADIPWGVIAFIVVLILLLTHDLKADDITGLGTAAGLLGVGHGIHLGAKSLGRRRGAAY